MSNEAITWSLRLQLPAGNAPVKHLLFILANQANGDPARGVPMLTHPSIPYIVDATGMDRKTIIAGLQKLRDWGLISDTGRRCGRTGQVIVYELHTGPDLLSPVHLQESRIRNGSDIGTVTGKQSQSSAVTVPNTDANSPKSGTRNPRNLREPERETDARAESIDPAAAMTQAGQACRLMRAAGATATNPSHPDLLAALAEGVTAQALADTVGEAIDGGRTRPFAWAIATARDRHRTGARQPSTATAHAGTPHAAPRNPRESRSARAQRRNAEFDARERAAGGDPLGVAS